MFNLGENSANIERSPIHMFNVQRNMERSILNLYAKKTILSLFVTCFIWPRLAPGHMCQLLSVVTFNIQRVMFVMQISAYWTCQLWQIGMYNVHGKKLKPNWKSECFNCTKGKKRKQKIIGKIGKVKTWSKNVFLPTVSLQVHKKIVQFCWEQDLLPSYCFFPLFCQDYSCIFQWAPYN